ncbi:S41 family peptidase [Pseudonocardia endophytica]|uniref:Tricorn protease homolog n=1 Tax=Pseudonocardia endophytica TaxID=401976 RepID=A0A4V2PJ06_PSEEN|nr:S41 family peptidase [Pseudonocardia endophytica]TCK26626.1 tricorn protease [Pseudonocardia endophytica]
MAYLRFPHLHGDTVVFTAEDDVWTAPLDGGRAWRLTADGVPVSSPRISPDGARVAWSSRRDGAAEVYVADVEGGGATRLTWWGDPATSCAGWTADGDVIAISGTGDATDRRWAFAVPAGGGSPRRLPYGPLTAVGLGGDGAVATLSGGGMDAAWWKRYRGGTAGRVWLDATGSGEFERILADVDGQLRAPMIVGSRLAFLSDHEGWGNLYSVALNGGDLRRHTDHGADGAPAFYVRQASTDGERVVYASAGRLYVVESLDADSAPREIDVRLGGPRSARETFRADVGTDLRSFAPDRTGRTSVVGVRGTVHRLTHRDGPSRTLLAEPGVRARMAEPLGTDRAVWVDDADGEDAVCVAPLDPLAENAPELRRLSSGRIGRVLELTAAPDGSAVALATHDGRLLVLHLTTTDEWPDGTLREITRGGSGEVSDLAWSPDSAWLAFCDPPEPGLSRIVLARITDGDLVEVTPARFHDSDPVFTSDGKYLAFLSRRVFDPSYDQHSFDLTFQTGWKPFLVPLAARTPSPFGAGPDGRPVSPEEEKPEDPPAPDGSSAENADGPGTDEKTGTKRDKDTPPEVVVEPDGIAERVVGIPVEAAVYVGLAAAKDALLWRRFPISGTLGDSRADDESEREKPWLERYDLTKRTLTTIADPCGGFAVSGDGTRVVTRDAGTLRVLRADRSGSSAPSDGDADEFEIDTKRLVVSVDPSVEWRQMFDEAARLMRDHFWVADMAGVDWDAEVARYRPLVDEVGSHNDLVDVLWELQGELGTSHAYVMGGGAAGVDATGRPGLLGADLEPAAQGSGWVVRRVLPPESSAPAARSPLSGPGVDVRAGDEILEVGGVAVDPDWGPAPLLLDRAGRLVELTVRSGPDRADPGEVRRVVVRPLRSEHELRYQDWVAGRRAAVAERSGGRLGYLHVPDMMPPGWAQLHRDLARETARDGLILDVRGNRGGHTSQLVVEKLARKVIGWDLPRHRTPSTYPEEAPRGPVVALADELSGSDGDIVTAAIRRLGIGPVVGVRTWGGVIGIDGRYGLVDGTRVTQPRYATWFDGVGWGLENHGVDPDVEVVITPQDWVAGRDPQLERAVDLALERLEAEPAARPPDVATRPSRARPPLPGRP